MVLQRLPRVPQRFRPPGFPLPTENPSGILAGLTLGSHRDFGHRDFAFAENPGGIAPRDFGNWDSASC